MTLGLFGAALLYGDGVITPAISVLAAVEGLEVAAPGLAPWVVPIAAALLLLLFALQKRGTAGVGTLFGPVMLVWFVTIALLGAAEVCAEPRHPRRPQPVVRRAASSPSTGRPRSSCSGPSSSP